MEKKAEEFLSMLIAEAKSRGLDLTTAEIDHLCFRTNSTEDYKQTKKIFSSIATMIAQTDVNGRPIAAFKLNKPWKFANHIIDLIEVPHPKKNKITKRGFEHFEVIIALTFDDFKKRYPQFIYIETGLSKKLNPELEIEFNCGAIKFHHMRLEEVIKIEQWPTRTH
jgi:predicted metalloenzyme YecM